MLLATRPLASHWTSCLQDIIILSGDHLYRMDYMKFVDEHRASNADVSIGCLPCDTAQASAFGLMKIDEDANITEFAEKPEGEALEAMKVRLSVALQLHNISSSLHPLIGVSRSGDSHGGCVGSETCSSL